MQDPRIEQHARILVEQCLELQPGARVLVSLTGPAGLPLALACMRLITRAGAEAMLRPSYQSIQSTFLNEASEAQIDSVPAAELAMVEWATARITIDAPETAAELPPQPDPARVARRARTNAPIMAAMRKISGPLTVHPCPELARRAGMSLDAYADFVYAAVNYDWREMEERLNAAMARFEGGDVVRLVAKETDISFRIKDVPRFVSVGKGNMPSGEIYFSPVPDSTEGHIAYEWPCHWKGTQVNGVRLVFQGGRVVEATAAEGQAFLEATLNTDAGARRLGEFGVGLNPMIQVFTNNILFDEKIGGTIHLALGQAYGAGNESHIHWDMIKDCRQQSELYLDGKLIYRNGQFL
ncbi:MAG TPA: aminopeptidase [Symbiobacteriaceae bacterium]|jgi:aminopeptidase|nr:aminopeptidase [Symbiobacteriaceae bacterium]